MESVKKKINVRALHQRGYDKRVNERQLQTKEGKNDADADNAEIKPVYEEELIAEVQLIVEYNVFATEQQHAEQPDLIKE
ncbi:hypothetical protein Tco_1298294 [Tanacetum coccineum]